MTATTDAGKLEHAIRAWENDPGTPDAPYTPIDRPRPALDVPPLPLRITTPPPSEDGDKPRTSEFRYWAAAEALRRASDMWGQAIGAEAAWNRAVGEALPVKLDEGVDLNAFYDREALNFFHDRVDGSVYYSGESPDVVCHELGHAVLDALRPELWDTPFIEAAALHEAYGDMSAMLSALQLDSVREQLIAATGGRIHRNSIVSRLAEQLGWAIRQQAPDAVDRDALRNAANTWFYRDPTQLSSRGPASVLTSEAHNFSRVFSGAFLQALSGMLLTRGEPTADALLAVAQDAAVLLRRAATEAPVVPAYMSQFAAHTIAADAELFEGRYRDALTSGFVKHGVLSVPSATTLTAAGGARLGMAPAGVAEPATTTQHIALPREAFGLAADLVVEAPTHAPRFRVAGSTPDLGSVEHPAVEHAAQSFVEDLMRHGRIDFAAAGEHRAALASPTTAKSHELRAIDGGLLLRRRLFHCGFGLE